MCKNSHVVVVVHVNPLSAITDLLNLNMFNLNFDV